MSFSAVTTLAHGGAETVALVTADVTHQSIAPLVWATAGWRRVPLVPHGAVTRIVGGRRVEAVEVTDLRSGRTRHIACDTVVFTGDWIPDHELAREAGLLMDATCGPRVDCALATSADGVFAAGNLVHAAEAADVAALSGRHAAHGAHAYLRDGGRGDTARMAIECRPPVRWISPGTLGGGTAPPRGRFVLRVGERIRRGAVEVAQGVRVLWREPPRNLVPGRSIRLDAVWIGGVDPDGPPLLVRVIGD